MRAEEGHQFIEFAEGNAFSSDPVLPALLQRLLPPQVFKEVSEDCARLGDDITTTIRPLGRLTSPPTLTQYDQWGRRVDHLQTSEGWRALKAICQKEGIPGIFYERKHGQYSRLHGFAKMFLLMADSYTAFCPLSMTDGCAKILELHGSHAMREGILSRLTSRDPSNAFTSGQWMTERPGGSDVSQTETTARPTGKSDDLGDIYSLNGFKWFSSATDSEVSLALARTGEIKDGSRGLSLFLVPLRKPLLRTDPAATPPSSISNGIRVHRLKEKIGTHTLPTAELSLDNTEAYLLGELGCGVKNITPVLNITRVYSAISCVGSLRRCLAIATAYSRTRTVQRGETLLSENPLHVEELSKISVTYQALVHLTFGVIKLMGQVDHDSDMKAGTSKEVLTPDTRRLRMMTAVIKAFSNELAIPAMEQTMYAMGGAGYMEENQIGRLIRDALVEKIWEGTTSVLSIELSRAAQDRRTLDALTSWASAILAFTPGSLSDALQEPIAHLEKALKLLSLFTTQQSPFLPRPMLMLTGHICAALFLLEHASWSHTQGLKESSQDAQVFTRWVLEGGLLSAIAEVESVVARDVRRRSEENSRIVYGTDKSLRTKL